MKIIFKFGDDLTKMLVKSIIRNSEIMQKVISSLQKYLQTQ